jgi:DNA modification methylase
MSKSKTEPTDPVSALGFKPDFDTIILQGDCSNWLKEMPAESVNCAVTSPPYFGLRDYGTGTWEGGSDDCSHGPVSGVQGATGQRASRTFTGAAPQRNVCSRCGAIRIDQQIGLEATLEEYLDKLVTVFRDVWRVLRDDGTLWLNLGDSFASSWPCQRRNVLGSGSLPNGKREARPPRLPNGLKEKDLMGVPWRVALALQEDGWYLRCDIIWAKPNCTPENVRDRPTRAHEFIFLLTKRSRYYYDFEAIKEPVAKVQPPRRFGRREYQEAQSVEGYRGARRIALETGQGTDMNAGNHYGRVFGGETTRNKRSVWSVPTRRGYSAAHFAQFSSELIEPCILAGCPEGGVVLDPFAGSGTVGVTARSLKRRSVLIELNPEYVEMIENRLEDRFTTVSSAGLTERING